MKIGFIGLGNMGRPMSVNLIKAGHSLGLYDIMPENIKEVTDAGGQEVESPAKVAEQCEVIFTMLPNSPHVREVIMGENGVLEGVKPGSVIIDMSSITPKTATDCGEAAAEKGVEMLDAPVSGGVPKAIDGTLSIMVGGKQEVFDRIYDLFMIMGKSAILVGDLGSGNITKLANQIMVAIHLSSLSEAMVFAEKAGVDPEKVFLAIKDGLAGSVVMDMKMPLILDRNFKAGGPIRMHTKDLLNIRDTAQETGAPIPLSMMVLEAMKALKEHGKSEDDHCGVVQYWEMLAKVQVERKK